MTQNIDFLARAWGLSKTIDIITNTDLQGTILQANKIIVLFRESILYCPIRTSSWIPWFWSVHGSPFSRKMSCPEKFQIRVRIQSGRNSFSCFKIVQIESRFFSWSDSSLDTIWTFFRKKICPDRIQIQITFNHPKTGSKLNHEILSYFLLLFYFGNQRLYKTSQSWLFTRCWWRFFKNSGDFALLQ